MKDLASPPPLLFLDYFLGTEFTLVYYLISIGVVWEFPSVIDNSDIVVRLLLDLGSTIADPMDSAFLSDTAISVFVAWDSFFLDLDYILATFSMSASKMAS